MLNDQIIRANTLISRNGRRAEDDIDTQPEVTSVRFEYLGNRAEITGDFDESWYVSLTREASAQLDRGQLRLVVRLMNILKNTISNATIHVGRQTCRLKVFFVSPWAVISGNLGAAQVDIRVVYAGAVVIGDNTTINGARLIAVNSHILLGRDDPWSDKSLRRALIGMESSMS